MKLRFDVFIATAAERGYALEAWRLLDPDCRLIPANRVHRRVVCFPGSRQKKLEKVRSQGRFVHLQFRDG